MCDGGFQDLYLSATWRLEVGLGKGKRSAGLVWSFVGLWYVGMWRVPYISITQRVSIADCSLHDDRVMLWIREEECG